MKVLRPFQEDGVNFLLSRPRCILGDEMGCGKTLQAIRAAKRLQQASPGQPFACLVIAPAFVISVWESELSDEGITAHFPKDVQEVQLAKRAIGAARGGFMVVSWSRLSNLASELALPWSLVIVDEAHYAKNMDSERTKALHKIGTSRAQRVWLLSGTIMTNYPDELYAPLLLCGAPDTRGGFFHWRHRFCETETVKFRTRVVDGRGLPRWIEQERQVVRGGKNDDQLAEVMRPYYLARQLDEVSKEIPEMTWQTLRVGLGGQGLAAMRAAIAEAAQDMRATVPEIEEMLAGEGANPTAGPISRLRALIAMTKGKLLHPSLAAILEGRTGGEWLDPVIVFSSHLGPLYWLEEELGKKVPATDPWAIRLICGDTPMDRRTQIVADFQAGRTGILLAQTTAAGVGLTLTRSRRGIFIDLPWSPAVLQQAAARYRRIGQARATLTQIVETAHPVDRRVNQLLMAKARAWAGLGQALGRLPETSTHEGESSAGISIHAGRATEAQDRVAFRVRGGPRRVHEGQRG